MESTCPLGSSPGRTSMGDTPTAISLLIVYRRSTGSAVRTEFTNSRDALRARCDYEDAHDFDPDVEVVTITAQSIDLIKANAR